MKNPGALIEGREREFKIFKKPNPEKEAPVFQRARRFSPPFFYHLIRALNNPLYVVPVIWRAENPSTISARTSRDIFSNRLIYFLRAVVINNFLECYETKFYYDLTD